MTFSAKDMIRKRKSVRTFTGEPLENEDRVALEQYIQSSTNPFDVPVDFRLLDVKEYGLSSPVIVGADLYLAAKVKRCKHYKIGFGYSFDDLLKQIPVSHFRNVCSTSFLMKGKNNGYSIFISDTYSDYDCRS